jgi:hypothetical protein
MSRIDLFGGAGLHALAAGDAGRGAHRVVQVERDARGVALAGAADDVVALDVVAGPDAAVAEDAGVVVDGDDRVGAVGAPPGPARQVGGLPRHPEAVGEVEQQVVRGGGRLRVPRARRLVRDQQLGEHPAAAPQLLGVGAHLHTVLARAHARGGERPAAGVHHAHPAHPDRVVALVVAQHRDLDTGRPRRVEDRRALGHGDLAAVDRGGDGGRAGGRLVLHCGHGSPDRRRRQHSS